MLMIKRIWDVCLNVTDLERAVKFYGETLRLELKYRFHDYAGFDCGGVEVGLRTWGGGGEPRKGEPHIDFLVENIDEEYKRLREAGVEFSEPPNDTAWGARIAPFRDPDGNYLQLVQIIWGKYYRANAPD